MKKILKNNKGYTLLFAVIVSSIVLSVGISILTISKKEFQLSASARDSTIAFYAADSGMGCARYNDVAGNFPNDDTTFIAVFNCAGTSITPNRSSLDPSDNTYTFNLLIDSTTSSCAVVSVHKYMDGIYPKTQITSTGYNMGWIPGTCDNGGVASSRRVERLLELTL